MLSSFSEWERWNLGLQTEESLVLLSASSSEEDRSDIRLDGLHLRRLLSDGWTLPPPPPTSLPGGLGRLNRGMLKSKMPRDNGEL